jgi:hypothetical protein
LQLEQYRDHVRFKSQFVETIDLKIGWWLGNKGAVTIDEKDTSGSYFLRFQGVNNALALCTGAHGNTQAAAQGRLFILVS